MTQLSPTFSPSEFELRGYTNPWLNPEQQESVLQVETRVNSQLDYLAQMLGWNGPNYWGNLPSSVFEKRQLLGGSFGVYNGFMIPRILEIRNWDETILIEPLPNIQPGQKVYLGEDEYEVKSASVEGENYLISLGTLPESFYAQIAANVQLRVSIPTNRPSPFYRPSVATSGDNTFSVKASGSELLLYPGWDSSHSFLYLFPAIFSGSTYYFDQPVYLSYNPSLTKDVLPKYDQERQRWYIQVPAIPAEYYCFFVWEFADPAAPVPASVQVQIRDWKDPSDWGSKSVLENFIGTWGNKGGPLPFNFAFDSLRIHGFNEFNSVYLGTVERSYSYNELVNLVYSQLITTDPTNPGQPREGQLWWNSITGALSVWYPGSGSCSPWVEVDYRHEPTENTPTVVYPDVATFLAGSSSLQVGVTVLIEDISGLSPTNNILGLQGTITTAGALTLYKAKAGPYWTPFQFTFADVSEFASAAQVLPYRVSVRILNADSLKTWDANYRIPGLRIVIEGDYEVVLTKYQNNLTWEISKDSVMEFIAKSNLVGPLKQGEMWWDFTNPDPDSRAASVYISSYSSITELAIVNPGRNLIDGTFLAVPLVNRSVAGGADATADIVVSGNKVVSVAVNNGGQMYSQGNILTPDPISHPNLTGCVFQVTACLADTWVSVNRDPILTPPVDYTDISTLLVYCNGTLLLNSRPYNTNEFIFTYFADNTTGEFTFQLIPESFVGQVNLPVIEVSDSITSAYRADITNLVFSGLTYKMSPNVSGAETPLRLWKTEDLQVIDTVEEVEDGIYPNGLRADLNNGPGLENWQRYFVRLPLDYGRNDKEWQKTTLICQDFAYWGSTIEPEEMIRPSEPARPQIYEELVLLGGDVNDYTYVYTEPYLYSNLDYLSSPGYLTHRQEFETTYDYLSVFSIYDNSGVYPTAELEFDEFTEAEISEYDPLHSRIADVTSPVGAGYGNWVGQYVNINACQELSGYLINDLLDETVSPVAAPNWDASIYKYAPSESFGQESYEVDSNNYKVGYAYFVADASAAEEAFFDIQQECSWRYPVTQPQTFYILPR